MIKMCLVVLQREDVNISVINMFYKEKRGDSFLSVSRTGMFKLKAALTVNIFFFSLQEKRRLSERGTEELAAEPVLAVLLEDFQFVGRTPQADGGKDLVYS